MEEDADTLPALAWDESVADTEILYKTVAAKGEGDAGHPASSACRLSREAGAARVVRSNAPLPRGRSAFEVRVAAVSEQVLVGVVAEGADVRPEVSVATSTHAWTYDSTGCLRCAGAQGTAGALPKVKAGDVLCFVCDTDAGMLLAYRNGKLVGELNDLPRSAHGGLRPLWCCVDFGSRGDTAVLAGALPVSKKQAADLVADRGGTVASGAWVQVESISSSNVELKWGFDEDGGTAVTQQLLQLSSDGGVAWGDSIRVGAARRGRVGDAQRPLAPNTCYHVRVRGRNAKGWSEWGPSPPLQVRTAAPPAPSAPSLTCRALGAHSWSVDWSLDPGDGGAWGAPVLSYQLQTSSGREGEQRQWRDAAKFGPFESSYAVSVDGLQPYFHYSVRVRAVTRAGRGEWAELDLTTQEFRAGEHVQFWWQGPWMEHYEWHDGVIELVLEGAAVEKELEAQAARAREEQARREVAHNAIAKTCAGIEDAEQRHGGAGAAASSGFVHRIDATRGGIDLCTGMKPFRNMGSGAWRARSSGRSTSTGPATVTTDGSQAHHRCQERGQEALALALHSLPPSSSRSHPQQHQQQQQPLFGTLEISEQRRQKEQRARRFASSRRLGSLLDVGAQVVAAGAGQSVTLMPGAAARSADSCQPGGGAGLEWWQRESQAPPPERAEGASRRQQAWLYRVRSDQYPDHAPAVPFEWLRRPQSSAAGDASERGATYVQSKDVYSKEMFLDRVQKGFVRGRNCC